MVASHLVTLYFSLPLSKPELFYNYLSPGVSITRESLPDTNKWIAVLEFQGFRAIRVICFIQILKLQREDSFQNLQIRILYFCGRLNLYPTTH